MSAGRSQHPAHEEILKTHIAHWWSPDGTRLAYATINDSRVPVMELPTYTGSVYPTVKSYHYPKAGCENPSISLHVIGLNGPTHDLEMMPPDDPRMREYYITMVKWATSTKVAVNWLSRAQNVSILTLCDATTGVCTKKHEDESEAWLHRQNEEPVFSKDGRKFFFVRAIPQGGQGKFYHITVSSSQPNSSNDNIQSITSGDWDATKILSYDEKRSKIYFLSTEDLPRRRQLYSANTVGNFNRQCLSCDLVDNCTYFSASFSPSADFFLLKCEGPGVPTVTVHNTTDKKKILDLETNEHVQKAINDRQMPKVEYRKIEIDDYNLPVQILKPATFTDTAHYPLLLVVDGAPGSQSVAEKFEVSWETVMVSSHGAVVVKCDGRGSGFQGTKLLHEVKRRLGSLEEKDQMEAVRVMLKEQYIDKTRVAVFGKDYGGYLSAYILPAKGENQGPVFTCGSALSPITDFKLYVVNPPPPLGRVPDTRAQEPERAQRLCSTCQLLSAAGLPVWRADPACSCTDVALWALLGVLPPVSQPLFSEREGLCDVTLFLNVGEALSVGSGRWHSGQGGRESRPSAPTAGTEPG
ncbi:hypothetical protein J1605_016067 [Eschrichtius robustus]|uniref:A-type potassium channel modulatory protein DPP6 n=1 Tax=Eschrichtius robustus TaxID=9764 RepID=A0AB34GAI1_ESCRO|nr:hypothetical protein J1605_016067 [Eschrichtius robustus]